MATNFCFVHFITKHSVCQVSLTKKLVRSWLQWAGHVETVEGEWWMKRVDALRVEGRRGRPRLRWEDCMKKDLVGVGGEGRMRARDRGERRRLVEMAAKWD